MLTTNFLLVIGVLAMAVLAMVLIHRRRKKTKPAQTRTATPEAVPDAPPDAFAQFEAHMRSAFDFALLNSGYGSTQVWVTLRRAVKDIFLT